MRTVAVIGKNFGDEGKGMAVDRLVLDSPRPLVVRFNGGAQSGHTVERRLTKNSRFVFHELSSGSLCSAATLWIPGYFPDLYKLGEEAEGFFNEFGFVPKIYALSDTCVTFPDDVLINMALETSRGARRHGSCGMGINECSLRTEAGYGLSFGKICGMDKDEICRELFRLRSEYTPVRLKELEGDLVSGEDGYLSLLSNDNVLINASEVMAQNLRYVDVLTEDGLKDLLANTGTLIFEAGQGLLLDKDNKEYAPHLTSSNTGVAPVVRFLDKSGLRLDEAVYVSRSYVTRHGAGRLDCECSPGEIGVIAEDRTNKTNEWQGGLRYARHENENAFVKEVKKDISRGCSKDCRVTLFLTHLNETGNKIAMKDGDVPLESFLGLKSVRETFDGSYISDTPYTEDVKRITL